MANMHIKSKQFAVAKIKIEILLYASLCIIVNVER